jgi:hypothetical protein
MRFDVFAAPIGIEAGRRLAMSATPDAPVVADRRAAARRPRLRLRLRLRAQEA